ncbi:hypothetical protein GDO78_020193, partial [Eleutherodactylus coqui]
RASPLESLTPRWPPGLVSAARSVFPLVSPDEGCGGRRVTSLAGSSIRSPTEENPDGRRQDVRDSITSHTRDPLPAYWG